MSPLRNSYWLAVAGANCEWLGMVVLAASVALLRRREVLLIQRNRAPSQGLWTLPGGRLDPGETSEQCAAREVREELDLAVRALRPVQRLRHEQFVLQVFATEAFDGEIRPDPAEVRAWRWAQPHHLAALRTTPGLADVLAAVFRLFERN
jgi:ADP-ribose pyrophosphatase YjhB (NUDIX family)